MPTNNINFGLEGVLANVTETESHLFERYPKLEGMRENYFKALNIMIQSYASGGKLLAMGNGGSSADAEHLCGELQKGFLLKRPLVQVEKDTFAGINPDLGTSLQRGLPSISLGVAHASISAFGNDVNPHYAFAQQIFVLGQPRDCVLAFSTSGNSKNVVHGLEVCQAKKIPSIALTGSNPSRCSELADVTLQAPSPVTHEAQEFHLPIYHALCIDLEVAFFGKDEPSATN